MLVAGLNAVNMPEAADLDINTGLPEALAALKPDVVIHTSGPFQAQDYHVAKACIVQGCHYIDLADGRAFVDGITVLDEAAIVAAVLSGGIFSFIADYVRKAIVFAVGAGAVSGFCYWVWVAF